MTGTVVESKKFYDALSIIHEGEDNGSEQSSQGKKLQFNSSMSKVIEMKTQMY